MMIQTQQEQLKEATEDLPFPGGRQGGCSPDLSNRIVDLT
jgi:hypothetical protein